MTDPTSVPLHELRRVFDVLIQHVEQLHGPTIELDADYFWSVPPAELYDPYKEPTDLTIGQLTECLENLERIAADPEAATSYALVWLGDILRAAGHSLIG